MSAAITAICLVDAPPELARAFGEEGGDVLSLKASPAPFFDLPAALAEAGFVPDLVLQVERLGVRSVLTGLGGIDCPLLFWAIDPHLNAHWHSAYGRLFDVVCSTQRAWMDRLAADGAADVRWLPWFGEDRPLVPWDKREHGLAFVGRVTSQRPARKWMVEYLLDKAAAFNPAIRDSVPKAAMLDLYDRSRIIPNESIFGEVNFRLFEGASCGCLVIGQDIGEQAELFEPGRETDACAHVVELDDKLSAYLKNDKLVRTMGLAAHARVQAEHLPKHRARRILEYAHGAARNRATGREAAKWTALAACRLLEAGLPGADAEAALGLLAKAGQGREVAAATLRLQAMANVPSALKENLRALLPRPTAGSPDLNLAASMAALRVGEFGWAKTFWYRHLEDGGGAPVPPRDPRDLYGQWARNLQRRGLLMRPGFAFDPARHLPATAMDCLLMVLEETPEDLPTLRRLDAVLRPVPGTDQTRVGYLSILTLHERNDWRLALEIALADLASYRLESGLDELRLSRELAAKIGQESAFFRALKGRDPSGGIVRRIGL